MSVSCESAVVEDLPQLVELLGLLFAQETEFAPDAARQHAALEDILREPALGRIYVARESGRVLGMASLLFSMSTAEGGKAAWLEDFVVRPDSRRRGIGSALARHVIAQARAAGVARITLLTDTSNVGAQHFYRGLGFGDSEMRPMRLRLR